MEKIKLLMADDNQAVLSQLSDFFSRKADIEIAGCAHDGAEALALIEKTAPDIVLLDIIMPRLDGFGLITEIRKTHPKDKLAIIGVSAQSGEQTARFLKHGANDFLTKPIGMEEFYCRVNQQMDMLDILQDYKALCGKMAS